MDRCVVLVDVGYLLAEGGKAYCGATKRSQVRCDYAGVAATLEALAVERSGLPLLRSYWYDGARDYLATPDHHVIGSLPRVKLRLGRLVMRKGRKGNEFQQKGVDSLIVHDLITLAHERAAATALLLAGAIGFSLRGEQELRRVLRAAFWKALRGSMSNREPQSLLPRANHDEPSRVD